ncbi:MAG: hemolysin family protein [Salinisphaera sp.]|nr:hemolysin family protein [Salinisphaera sp.]
MLAATIIILLLLIVLNGLLSLSEMALVAARPARLRILERQGARPARLARRLHEEPGSFLSTVQIGITLIGVLIGALGGATLAAPLSELLGSVPILAGHPYAIALGIIVAITTYLTLIIGELVPKRVALRFPEQVAVRVARPMTLLARTATPAVWVLEASTEALLHLLRMHGNRDNTVTEDEVRSLITEGTRKGVFDPREQAMIEGVLRLDDRTARSAMVPRPGVIWLDIDDDLERIREIVVESGHSRFPVCRGEVDEVLGIVRTRDILDPVLRGAPVDLGQAMAEPLIVLDTMPIIQLLERFKKTGVHLAMVVDEYGSLEGVITITRVMEIIAGDLSELGQPGPRQAVQRDDGAWLVDGMLSTDDFTRILGLEEIEDASDFHTVAGLVLHCLERVPAVGDQVDWRALRLEILAMDGNRIDKVLATLPDRAPAAASQSPGAS